MQTSDRPAFAALMQRLAETFDKPLTDGLVASYWEALKDQHIGAITRRVDGAIKTSRFFPRPAQLRPADEKPGTDSSANEPHELERMNREATEHWAKVVARDGEEGRLKLRLAQASRREALAHPSHPEYREICLASIEAQAALFAFWERKRANVSRGTSPAKPAPMAEIAERITEELA